MPVPVYASVMHQCAQPVSGDLVYDDPHEWETFSQQVEGNGNVWESQLVVQGMHCAACADNVESALSAVPGVCNAQVNAASQRLRLRWDATKVRPSTWMQSVYASGYRLMPAADALTRDVRRQQQRKMLWRWLVATLCMMQVMMYAWPAYVAAPGDMSPSDLSLMRWACWVLTVPVMVFSCGPFFSSAWRDLRQCRMGMDLPVALGLLITFGVSSAATFDPNAWWSHEVWFDSLTMFVFFLLSGRWLELRLRERTVGALEQLMQRRPEWVERQRTDGSFEFVAMRRLVVGDVLRVRPGDAFVADGCIIEGQTLADEALLTGESRPLLRRPGAEVLAGSHNLSGLVLMQVHRLGKDTRYAQIVALMERASVEKPRLVQLADCIAKPFLWLVLLSAAAAAAWWWRTDPTRALIAAVAVLIVTCPCALSLAAPVTLLAAAGSLARRGVLVQRLQALEDLALVDTVVFDKTGTLTEDRLQLLAIHARRGLTEQQALQWAAALAQHSLHPVSCALQAAAMTRGAHDLPVLDEVTEIPGRGMYGAVSAHNALMHVSRGRLRLGSAEFCGPLDSMPASVEPGVRQVYLTDEQGLIARFDLQESLRADAVATVQALQAIGLEVRLLSGDREEAVQALADRLGLTQAHGACSPSEKLQTLRAWQVQGHRVLMVGDGLNDGPVLAGANASVAMGHGVPLAQARADVVLMGSQLSFLVVLVHKARLGLRVVRQNLIWAALYNALCVPLAVAGWLPAWLAGLGMAVSSLFVIANAARLVR